MPQSGREPPVRETPPTRPETLRRWDPERIGPYVVLGRLGSGSMGQVYLGRSAAGRLVAVKTIKVELAEEAGFRRRFAQEVAAARKVSGVFTAAVVEADPEADLPWLATAYVPAPSLARLVLACGPLPVTTVRWLAAGCAEALESIHGAGLVHRDLKPSNVLVAPDGPRVIDFGVARAAERMGRTTSRGAVGTPAYMAPEQARDTHEASVASDVYSLGATLLFAATGHPPYQGATVMDVLARLATEEPDLSGLPDELTELITACMARVPRQRPTSSAMLAQLGDFTEAQAGPDEEHAYLPAAAMALIGQYRTREFQRSPQPSAVDDTGEDRGDDATSASYTELPASYKPASRRKPGTGSPGPGRVRLAAMAQVAHGLGRMGVRRSGPDRGGCHSRRLAHQLEHPELGRLEQASRRAAATAGAAGRRCARGPLNASDKLMVCMNRSLGYPSTAFVVEGAGFAPHSSLTVWLTGKPDPIEQADVNVTSPVKPVIGADGTFRSAISQLFPDSLQLGQFTVEVTGSDGQHDQHGVHRDPRGAPLTG